MRRAALHIAGLWALAAAQPVFALIAGNPEFFIAHRAGAIDILLFAFVLTFGPPIVLAAVVAAGWRLSERIGRAAASAVIGVLGAAFVAQAAYRLGVSTWPAALIVAAIAAVAVAVLWLRSTIVRSFLTVLSAAAVIVPALFLATPGIRSLVLHPAHGPVSSAPTEGQQDPSATPVVVVVFDETPIMSFVDGRHTIDPELYPNFAALARDGVWFRNATTVNDFTRWAMPAIVTGVYPKHDEMPTPADHPDTLFTLLAPTHRFEVSEAVTALCPECGAPREPLGARLRSIANDVRVVMLHVLLPADLESGLPDLTAGWAGFADDDPDAELDADEEAAQREQADNAWRQRWRKGYYVDSPAVIRAFFDGITADDRQPTFYFIHSLVSHHPYAALPSGQINASRAQVPGQRRGHWIDGDDWAIAQHYQRHLLQMRFIDRLAGRMIERLKAAGLYDRALIVITADHGISFLPGAPLRDFRESTAAEIMRVPLLIKFPARIDSATLDRLAPRDPVTGERISDANAETVDVAPTVADVLGVDLPWRSDGSSLIDPARKDRPVKRMFIDQAKQPREFGPEGPDWTPALRRKFALFGESGNPWRVPTPPKYASLVGRAVSEFPIVEGEAVEVDYRWAFVNFDPSVDPMPFDVGGRFAQPRPDTYVAVAVNGIIRAVTRTWDTQPRGWQATPPLDAWRAGHNELDVFVVSGDEASPVLRRPAQQQVRPADLNLASLEAAEVWSVRQRGFWDEEQHGRFRWTNGEAVLTTMIDPRRPPSAVRLELLRSGAGNKRLRVAANGCQILDTHVPRGRWAGTLPLGNCPLDSGVLRLTLDSDVTPRHGTERRRLGVAVSKVVLVGSTAAAASTSSSGASPERR
ncbi:MAG TPA: sulfatase-like hydrolase/transferase [Gemmatimonadaceae bacterium]|nr:sulfatase-like hydrolase/transferase [Vicinamibacterales bacterium]